ncbi:PRC-barrel domain-containing protein [Pontibaca methylaminivorans]|uniref:PRC-barrel domain-containing protein n=1 Tax=Pontibaca methylaminivorans TaxID=515897 RepID=UPI002FDAAC27
MMSNLFRSTSILAAVAMLATAPLAAYAQDDTTGTDAPQTLDEPADGTGAPAEDGTMDTAPDGTMDDTAPDTAPDGTMDDTAPDATMDDGLDGTTDGTADDMDGTGDVVTGDETDAEEAAAPVEGQIIMQSEDTILGKDLIGSTVYTASGDEAVGSISNLIINLDEGSIQGVVIGVGGFLGIGKKLVAIEMDKLDVTTDENGNTQLTTSATRADLEAAEEFVSAKEQQSDAGGDAMGDEPASDPMLDQ